MGGCWGRSWYGFEAADKTAGKGCVWEGFLVPWLGDPGSDPVRVTCGLVGGEGDSTENNPN